MSSKTEGDATLKITTGGTNYLPQASALHGYCFMTDPPINYMLNSLPAAERRPYIPKWIGQLLQAAAMNDGVIDEIDGFASSAVWMPPGSDMHNLRTYWAVGLHRMLFKLGVGGLKRMFLDYQRQADAVKKERLHGRGWKKFYCVFFVSTKEERRGKGLAATLVERLKDIAGEQGLPIWLESTTEGSRRLYKRLGFEVVKEIVMGEGVVDANGERSSEGPGVRVWPMIWEPRPAKS